jgi:hypothetical protein
MSLMPVPVFKAFDKKRDAEDAQEEAKLEAQETQKHGRQSRGVPILGRRDFCSACDY